MAPVDALIEMRNNINSTGAALPQPPSLPQFGAAQPPTASASGFGSGKGAAAVSAALGYKGMPYQWGGTGQGGIDCSGLLQQAYAKVGINLPRTTYDQVRVGQPVSDISQAQPGDAIFLHNDGHVGIYVGNGMMIDANHTGGWVDERPVAGYGPIAAIRRYS